MKSMLQKMGCGASRKLDNTKLVDDFFGTNYNNKRNSPRQDEDNSINSNDEYDDHFVIDNGDDYPDYSLLRCTDNETQSNPSGRTSRSGDRSGKSGSARSRRSGNYSDRSGRSYRSGGSQRVNMAGSFSGSTSSSRQTEQRRNKGRPEPRSPPPPYMNIYIREDKQPSFSAPISSEDFAANVLLDNILDANAPPPNARATIATAMPMPIPIPILPTAATPTAAGASNSLDKDIATENTHNQASKPLATPASVTARTTATATVTPAANNKKEAVGNNPPKIKGAAASSGAKKKKEHKAASSSNAAPVKSNSKTKEAAAVGPTESKTVQIAETKKAASTIKSGGNANTKSSGTNANTNLTTANNNFVPVSVAPPAPPFTSLVRDGNENPRYDDILLSPLTAPTMATMLPQFPKHVKDDEFSTAPSLAGQKRSIVTVSKRVENKNNMTNGINNNNSSNNININSTIDEINFCDSVEKRVTTDKSFDDIYERGKQLGYGAFANVFLATHKPSGAKYAVKEVDRTSMVWNDKDHLQHEIDNMFKVREGPNIVQLYEVYSNNNDDDEDDEEEDESLTATTSSESNHKKKKGRKKKRKKKSLCHLVVELMEGGELFDRIIEKRTFTEREARDSVRCVLEALKYMHDRRVVHRDLKPENLLLKLRDRLTPVKLADFGFAKSIKTKNGCRSLCGTPGYLAPEILERFPSYDVKCDVWSVGAILFLLLGGYLPFDDDNEEKVFDRTRNADYDFQPRCWSNISFGAKELITRCLTVDPRKRFTAEDCLNHDWMSKSKVARDDLLGTDKLQDSRSKGKRKMRAAVKTLMAANRLQQLNTDFENYLEKKRQDSTVSHMSYMTTGTRYGHAKFEEDGPSGQPFKSFYNVGELLGEDDYCSVHRCLRVQTNMSYDVKHVHLTNLDKNSRKTVRDEITALKLLRGGPHVIRLLDVFEEKNNPDHIFLVFEAMKGGNLLSRIVEKEVYTEREARQVCKTVFTAINYCHKKKVAHRDIKPQNVFLHEEGDDTSVRVANFGFAKRVTGENSLQTLCGTANYVAPEILDNKCSGYDQRCDIWSLGVFTYVLLGGYPPFEGVHENLAVEIMRGEYVFDEEYWGEISDSAKRMIQGMLLVDPKKRITLSKALSCKWMEMEEERLVLRDLSTAQNSIRETLKPVAKVKAAVNAILARNKFLSIAGMFKHNDTTSIAYGSRRKTETIDEVEVEENTFRDVYLWGSQIGIGSFSVVHEVMKKDTKGVYATKRIDRKSLHPNDAIALHDEIAALEEVADCEQIVKLYNHFDEPDYTFLVLECMKGGDLIDRIIEKHNYTEFDAKEVCRQLLMGVAYCHEKKIANRNLKPENLLLTANSDTEVKISDFGYAKTVIFKNSLRTQCGTEGYVAPEILEHRPNYDISCDMWSLGVILYIVLGGYRPFRGEGDDVMRQIRYGEYKFHKRYWNHISDDAKNLITRMLTVDPEKRITATSALRNRWIQADEISLGGTELSNNMKDLKDLRSAKRKVKAATKAIIATNKLQSIGDFRAYQDF